jgi:hypothetical protein
MNIDIEELFNDELMALNWLVDEFGIPDDVFRECGGSYLVIMGESSFERIAASRGKDITGHVGMPKEMLEKARANFERLCQSAPHIPRDAMESLSLAYGGFAYLTGNGTDIGNEDNGTLQSHMRALFATTMARGIAMGRAGLSEREIQTMNNEVLRKKNLSKAGAKGALVKLQPYAALKTWALEKAVGMRDQDVDIARKLSAQIPEHLADVSKNPERLIYEALRAQRTPD